MDLFVCMFNVFDIAWSNRKYDHHIIVIHFCLGRIAKGIIDCMKVFQETIPHDKWMIHIILWIESIETCIPNNDQIETRKPSSRDNNHLHKGNSWNTRKRKENICKKYRQKNLSYKIKNTLKKAFAKIAYKNIYFVT